MATSLDQLSVVRYGKLYTTALMGDLDAQASVKDLIVKAQDSIIIKPNLGLGADAVKKFQIIGTASVEGAMQVDNVVIDDNTVSTSTGSLSLSSNAGSVRVADVMVTAASLTPSSDVDLSIVGGATKSVLVEGVKFTDNAVTTSSGTLAISSAGSSTAALKLGGVTVTDASVSSSTANGNLTMASNGAGAVLMDNVRVKASGISNNVANADLSITSNGTGSVAIDSVKVKTANITTSSGTLSLTSAGAAANRVDVGGLTVTNASISAASASTVTVAKDLTLTSTAGGSGKVTTSAGNLELTSASGTVAVTGALTGSSTITSTGNMVVGGDLKVAGVLESTNASGNLEVMDKTVKLSYQPGSATIMDFPFTSSANAVAAYNINVSAFAGASVSGGALNISTTNSSRAFFYYPSAYTNIPKTVVDWATENVNVEFPMTLTAGLATSTGGRYQFFGIESFSDAANQVQSAMRLSAVSGALRLDRISAGVSQPVVTSDNVNFLNAAGTYLVKVALSYSGGVCTAAFTYSKDGGATVPITFGGSPTTVVTNSFTSNLSSTLGIGSYSETANQNWSVDYFKVTKGVASTNAASDSAGLYVDGSSSYSSRALTWHMGAGETSQDKGDHTGSYWHFEGGQLLLSRTIAASDREAPATNVNLASLASGSDALRWEFSSGKASTVGSATFSGTGTVAAGVLKESGSQFDTVSPNITGTFSLIVKVLPQFDLSTLTLLTDLIGYGWLQVQVSSGGFLTFSDGLNAAIVMSTPVHAEPFTLCITMSGAEVKFYLDGVLVASSTNGSLGSNPQLVLNGAVVGDVWYDDVRFVSGQALVNANTMLYGWKEMYAADQTVTYGFRIANNEGLQLVKVRGSGGSNGWVGINPAPNTVTSGNSMGAIGAATAAVITESQMSY